MLKLTEHEFHAQNKVKMATVIVISTVVSIKKNKILAVAYDLQQCAILTMFVFISYAYCEWPEMQSFQ